MSQPVLALFPMPHPVHPPHSGTIPHLKLKPSPGPFPSRPDVDGVWPHARALLTDGGKWAVRPIWDGDLDPSSDFQQMSIEEKGREVGFTVMI